ncbi:hypothetical protein TK90_2764 (plasmid) [Thioalkalivibrio sp. K90mix]|uniref:hypothetical protein n=1 Tax=Thioalkalivibrio sp. (strain K90mix) TaxID=396595 RepID=UPI000195A5F8|nr:hypothetical protein [Thioalkalivibrio sp. K90mix]ADC73249.1 hypothetical protein TK90_2764 [Thioalkalivibrio sp. K90mix]
MTLSLDEILDDEAPCDPPMPSCQPLAQRVGLIRFFLGCYHDCSHADADQAALSIGLMLSPVSHECSVTVCTLFQSNGHGRADSPDTVVPQRLVAATIVPAVPTQDEIQEEVLRAERELHSIGFKNARSEVHILPADSSHPNYAHVTPARIASLPVPDIGVASPAKV